MKRNKQWLNNPNATKNPKVFNVMMYRDETGRINLMGDNTLVLDRKNNTWERVNTRAFGQMLNTQGVEYR